MVRSKPLFALASVVMMAALAFSVLAVTNLSAHATAIASVNGTPRFAQFHHSFPEAALATSGLKHWSSSFTAEGKWRLLTRRGVL